MKKHIAAEMRPDFVEPYKSMQSNVPIVLHSDHPRFKEGDRLDWGFVQVALKDGWSVSITAMPYVT